MLTKSQVALASRLWAEGVSRGEIATAIGITIDTLRAREADQLAGLPQRVRRMNSGRRGELPDADEIRLRCAMLRQAWPAERFIPPWDGGERLGRMAENAAF
jgi:hypothetical protein